MFSPIEALLPFLKVLQEPPGMLISLKRINRSTLLIRFLAELFSLPVSREVPVIGAISEINQNNPGSH